MFLLDCEIDAYAVHADGGTPGGWSVEIGLVRGLITGVDDYMPITPGEEIEIADSAIAELILRSDDPLTTPVVRSAKWRILEVRRTETGSVTAPAGGYAEVYFDWPFGEVPQIQVTANDAAAVASVRVYEVTSGKRKAGFRVIAYDGAGAAIAADLSWTATGYGQRVNIPPSAGLPAPPPRYST